MLEIPVGPAGVRGKSAKCRDIPVAGARVRARDMPHAPIGAHGASHERPRRSAIM